MQVALKGHTRTQRRNTGSDCKPSCCVEISTDAVSLTDFGKRLVKQYGTMRLTRGQ